MGGAAAGRALVVCNHDAMAGAVARVAEAAGLRTVAAPDGERALDLCDEQAFDAVVVALDLPGISAEDVCRRLRPQRHLAIVVVSTGGDHRRAAAFAAGADDHVDVPFHARELEARIRALVRRTAGPLASRRPGRPPVADRVAPVRARCDGAVTATSSAREGGRED